MNSIRFVQVSSRHVALIAILVPAFLMGVGCKPASPAATAPGLPPVPVQLAIVESHGMTATEEVVGTVRAKLRAAVEAMIAGRIEALLVAPGQLVKQGETIASLDAREIKARLDSAQAVRDQATRDLQRISRLVKDGASTASELDAVQARQRVSVAAVSEAETMLGHARIVAPFDGVITRKLADVGDLATPGRPLVEIADPAQLRFESDVPEALLDRLQLGVKLPVRVSSLKDSVEGAVSEIAPMAEAVSRTYLVKLDLPVIAGLRAGQFGRVSVPTGEAAVPHVPMSAVVQRGQLEYVYVVDAGKAHLRLIRTGKPFGTDVEVVSGINAGERVVADPSKVLDGQPVEAK